MPKHDTDELADALWGTLQSPNVPDSNLEAANVVDVIAGAGHNVTNGLRAVASAITPADCMGGHDETGGTITSLTESVMGMTAGLCRIASAIESLADAIRDRR